MLTAVEKQEALEAVDFLLDYLFLPIRKDAWDEYLKLEMGLFDLFVGAWDDQVQKAVLSVAEATVKMTAMGITIGEEEVGILANALKNALGPELALKVGKKAGDLLKAGYLLGKKGVWLSDEVDEYKALMQVGLNLEDSRALEIMSKHTTYWVGNAYSEILSNKIEDIVAGALKQGLGRKEVAQQLRLALISDVGDRPKHYWELLAGVVMNRSRNLGSVSGFVEAGVTVYEIFNPMDERTSDICRFMNGKQFRVSDLVRHRNKIMAAKSPEEIKAIAPWYRLRQSGSPGTYEIYVGGGWKPMPGDAKSLGRLGLYLPPYHGHCRSSVIAVEYDAGDPSEPLPIAFEEIEEPPPPPPTVPVPEQLPHPKAPVEMIPDSPDGWGKIPQAAGLKFLKDGAYLGGAGRKYVFVDADGNQYLVKPAITKSGKKEEPFRAYVQEAVARLSYKLLGPDRTIEVVTRVLPDHQGKPVVSSVQRLLGGVKGNIRNQGGFKSLSGDQIRQVFREHTVDWLTGNFDAHDGQFIVLADGKILGADKENAFKFWRDPKSLKMSRTYAPNPEWPIYNDLFDAFAKGKIDLDLNDVLPAIQRVEAMSDQEFLDIFARYRDALPLSAAEKAQLAEHMLQRKHGLREEYRRFFSELLEERTGKKGIKFQFADEIPKGKLAEAPIAAKAFSEDFLKGLSWKPLFDLAKAQGLKYANSASKTELIAFLMDPAQKSEIEAAIKARKAAAGARRAKKPKIDRDEAVWDDLSLVREDPWGEGFHRDADLIEGQWVRVKRAAGGGIDGYIVEFKTTEHEASRIYQELKNRYASGKDVREGDWLWLEDAVRSQPTRYDLSRVSEGLMREFGSRTAFIIEKDGYRIEFWKSGSMKMPAMWGQTRITINGDGKEAANRLRAALTELGLDRAIAKPTADEEYRLRLMRVLWQDKPQEESKLRGKWRDISIEELERIAGPEGVERAKRLVRKDMGHGYFTWVDPEVESLYPEVVNLWAGITSSNAAKITADVLQNGLMSTVERWTHGITARGASSLTDFSTGGADSAFTRLVTKGRVGVPYRDHFGGNGSFRVVFSKRVLERTDWYAYHEDQFGTTAPSTFSRRPSAIEFVRKQMKHYTYGNEVMFRKHIPPEYIERVDADSESARQALIDELKGRGITTFNGKPVEEIVQVRRVTG